MNDVTIGHRSGLRKGLRFASFAFCLFLSGCYHFNGISIEPGVETFFVENLTSTAQNVPPNMPIDFTEKLKDKVRSETRLTHRDQEPDIIFSGSISDFRVSPVAPKPGEFVTLNRLDVRISVRYVNNKVPKKSWPEGGKSFSYFAEFDNQQDLLAVQDRLLEETIYPQLLEDIFNAAFNDW